jgi:Acetyltransferase (GNAT) family
MPTTHEAAADEGGVPVVAPRFRRDAIRVARFGDQERIAKLEAGDWKDADYVTERRAWWRKVLLAPASGPNAEVWVAVEDGVVMGVAYCDLVHKRRYSFAQLLEFRVAPYDQDRGIQTLLLNKAIKFAKGGRCSTLSVILPSEWESYEGDTQRAVAALGFSPVYQGPVRRTGETVNGQVLVMSLSEGSR